MPLLNHLQQKPTSGEEDKTSADSKKRGITIEGPIRRGITTEGSIRGGQRNVAELNERIQERVYAELSQPPPRTPRMVQSPVKSASFNSHSFPF